MSDYTDLNCHWCAQRDTLDEIVRHGNQDQTKNYGLAGTHPDRFRILRCRNCGYIYTFVDPSG